MPYMVELERRCGKELTAMFDAVRYDRVIVEQEHEFCAFSGHVVLTVEGGEEFWDCPWCKTEHRDPHGEFVPEPVRDVDLPLDGWGGRKF
jgi:hypothetical protein